MKVAVFGKTTSQAKYMLDVLIDSLPEDSYRGNKIKNNMFYVEFENGDIYRALVPSISLSGYDEFDYAYVNYKIDTKTLNEIIRPIVKQPSLPNETNIIFV